MQRISQKEIGQLWKIGHFKNVQKRKIAISNFRKSGL